MRQQRDYCFRSPRPCAQGSGFTFQCGSASTSPATRLIEETYATQGEGTRLLAALGTRLVVLVVLVFLVQILVSLYRYYLRLESFYRARADVMAMAPEMDSATLQSVATTLSANLEFKAPASPTEQAVEILKTIGGVARKG